MDSPDIVNKAATVASLLDEVKSPREQLTDRARGIMLGLAVGNLLGLPVESWRYEAIDRRYPQGMTDIDPLEVDRPMDDDVAQAVDLGEALVEGGDYISGFAERLVKWRRENGRGIGILTSTVINELEYGLAPPEAARLVYRDNPIAPNGGLMRCAPVALARHRQPELLIKDSAATCVVTHFALTCQWSCIIINVVIAMLLRGAEPDLRAIMSAARADGAPDMLAISSRDGIPTEVLSAIESGRPAIPDASWLRQEQRLIGHTLLAMQAGLWAAVTPLPFESALRLVVEAGGDTDTNGAVVGAVLGARYGATAIPQRWLDCIPERDRIEGLVRDLTTLAGKKNFDAAFKQTPNHGVLDSDAGRAEGLKERKKRNLSRFSDNPFRDPNAAPEQLEWLESRDKNMRLYRETGDRKYLETAFRPLKKDSPDSDPCELT